MIHDFIVSNYGTDNIYLIFYILNIIFGIIAFKLGFARKLPIAKTVIVYILLAIGMYIITIFSIFKMPMTESLIIISVIMGIYRLRLHQQRKAKETS
ncbi:YlaH-like family protein [Oceanobacillus halotolerans]|uniref:YlaH-like family protein n=1 Tax=Oceanobacillus halotolerans TaxID=2663380 RepID=UPI0013DC4F83|nr:YlaH-like family protein [Oceanobacillus halotolerans]